MTKSELCEILDKGMHTTMYERGPYIGTPHLLIDFRSPVEVPEFANGGDSTIYADYRWWEENPNCSCPHRYVLWVPKQWDTAEFQEELARHIFGRCAGKRQIDLVNMILLDIRQNVLSSAHHRDTVNVAVPLIGVIIYNAADPILIVAGFHNVPQQHLSGCPGADQHDSVGVCSLLTAASQKQHETVREANPQHGQELKHNAKNIVGNRHTAENCRDSDGMKKAGNYSRNNRSQQLIIACKAPDALIEPAPSEHKPADRGIDRRKQIICLQKLRIDCRKAAVEPKPQGEKIGRADCKHVIDNQANIYNLPVFQMNPPAVLLVTTAHFLPPSSLQQINRAFRTEELNSRVQFCLRHHGTIVPVALDGSFPPEMRFESLKYIQCFCVFTPFSDENNLANRSCQIVRRSLDLSSAAGKPISVM